MDRFSGNDFAFCRRACASTSHRATADTKLYLSLFVRVWVRQRVHRDILIVPSPVQRSLVVPFQLAARAGYRAEYRSPLHKGGRV